MSPLSRVAVGRLGRCFVLGMLVGVLPGCGKAHFPDELFTVHGEGADYPVMVSRPPTPVQGRPVNTESGIHAASSTQSYSSGNATVTVTTTQTAVSELPAATKLLAQVNRSDRALVIDDVEFYAEDVTGYSWSQQDRTMNVHGKVVR